MDIFIRFLYFCPPCPRLSVTVRWNAGKGYLVESEKKNEGFSPRSISLASVFAWEDTFEVRNGSILLTRDRVKQEAPNSLYSCACIHLGSCTTRKPVILLCIIYTPNLTIGHVTRVVLSSVCRDELVKLFRTGSLVTGNSCRHLERSKLKYAHM